MQEGRRIIIECPDCGGRHFVRTLFDKVVGEYDARGFKCMECGTIISGAEINCAWRFEDYQEPFCDAEGEPLTEENWESCED